MTRSDEEIKLEAVETINQVTHQIISAHVSLAAIKARPAIRKAFPFGPEATDREKEIWNDLVKQALSCWPRPLGLMVALFILLAPAARADNSGDFLVLRNQHGVLIGIIEPSIPYNLPAKKKKRFSVKVRNFCRFANPIIQFGGHTAQILQLFQ